MAYPEPEELNNPTVSNKKPKNPPIWTVRDLDDVTPFIDLNGITRYEECRWNLNREEAKRYKAKKLIHPRRKVNSKPVYNLNGVERILCRLSEITKSTHKRIYFGEGAKVMKALEKWELLATCVIGGAKCYNQGEDLAPLLKFDEIILLPDNDKDGEIFMHQIALRLSRLIKKHKSNTKMKLVNICPYVAKGDFADYQEFQTLENFELTIKHEPFYDPILDAKEKWKSGDDLLFSYGRDDDNQILNDFLETVHDTDGLRYIINENDKKGTFWDFDQPTNTWTRANHDDFERQKIAQFLKCCWQKGGKKKCNISERRTKNLIGLLKIHDWTLEKGNSAKAGYNFLPVAGNIDDELLIPHENGNLWVELKPPYRRILLPATPNHFHKSTRPWKYAEPGPGGEIKSKLQPKIHHDWFKDDPGGCLLFYEIGGYILTQKNTDKKIFYWLLETNAGKKVAMFQIEQLIGEDNCFPSKVSKSGRPFGQSMWVGKRLIIFPDLKQNPHNKNYLIDFSQQLAEVSGGDRCNVEGKGKDETAARLMCHFILVLNDNITMIDQQGEQINRASFLPFEHNVVDDPDIVTNPNLTNELNVEQELQIFEKLCLDADKARRIHGGEFSHSRFEKKYIQEFIRKGDEWVQFVEENIEQAPIDGDDRQGIFTDEWIEKACSWFLSVKNIHLDETSISVGMKIGRAVKKLKWDIKKSTARKQIITKKGVVPSVGKIWYGIKWISEGDL